MSALWTAGGTAPHEIDDANEKVKSWQEGERRGINYQTSVYIHRIYKWMNEWMMGSVMGFATSMGKEDFCQGRQNAGEYADVFSFLVVIF